MIGLDLLSFSLLAVVPVLVGPLQVLFAVLPGILVALGTLALSLLKPRVMKQMLWLAWRLKLPLLAAVGGIFLVTWGVRALVSASFRPNVDTEFTSGAWPMFRGGLARRGALPGAAEPNQGGVVWMHKKGSEGFFSSPAIVGDRVYVASAEISAFGSKGQIYCFDAATGAVLWAARPERYAATFSSPAVMGDYLVCGEGLHITTNARVVCLDIGEGQRGETLWTHETHNHVECTPVIEGERVFVNAGDDGIYCLHLAPQPAGESQLIWHLPGEKYPDAETSLAVHNGRVYVGLGIGGRSLRMLDAATGAELKRLDTPYPVFSPPAIANGRLYVGMGNGDYVNTAEEAREKQLERIKTEGASEAELASAAKSLGPAGEVWCVNAETLEPIWNLPVEQTVLGAVAVTNEGLYFVTRTGDVHFVSQEGKPLAKWSARAAVLSSPAVTEHYVYVVTNRGTLYALERETLAPVWEAPVSSQPLCISSPTIAHGHVYLGTQHDGFLCVGEPGPLTAEQSVPLWSSPLGGAGKAGNVDNSPLPANVEIIWKFPAHGDEPADASRRAGPAAIAVSGDRIIVPLSGKARGLICLPVDSGGALSPASLWSYETKLAVESSPVIAGDLVIAVEGMGFEDGRQLHAVSLTTGKAVWKADVSTYPGVVCVTAQQVLVQREQNVLTSYSHAGTQEWSTSVGYLEHAPATTENMIVAVSTSPRALIALDLPSGHELWRKSLTSWNCRSPVVSKDRIYLGTERGVAAFSLLDGSPLPEWNRDSESVSSELCVQPGVLAYASSAGEVVITDPQDGRVVRRLPGAYSMPPLVSREVLVYTGIKGLVRCNWKNTDAEPEEWCNTEDLAGAASPLVLHGSSIYQRRGRAALVRWGAAP